MKKVPWKALVAAALAVALLVVVVRSVLAGPQNTPDAKDTKHAARTILPSGVGDERAQLIVADDVAGDGIVEPADREVKIAGQVPGRIAKILVREGDHVEMGVAIAELESSSERAALEAAEGDLESAKADLLRTSRGLRKEDVDSIVADTEGARARAALSRDELERTEKLAVGGAATPDELDRARRQADSDKRALESQEAKRRAALAGSRTEDIVQSRAKVLGSAARRDEAKAQLERLTIRAPIAGEILQLKFRAGEYYTPGGDAIVIMGDTRVLRVRMDVDERDIARVALGANAFATASAFPGRRFAGKVVEIGKRIGRKNVRTDDPTERIDTKILEVVFQLDDRQGLVPGLRVVGYVEPQC
ncbi:MAG: efflux RND transporter periplasmic adaptor subunit [Polyangiaceae bacterium]|jgi:ABC exporter DevB family membrane fusion protein